MGGWVGTRAGESVGIFGCGRGLGVIVIAPGGSCIGDGGWILWCGFFAVDAFLRSCVVFFSSAGVACFAHVVGGSCVGSMRTFFSRSWAGCGVDMMMMLALLNLDDINKA